MFVSSFPRLSFSAAPLRRQSNSPRLCPHPCQDRKTRRNLDETATKPYSRGCKTDETGDVSKEIIIHLKLFSKESPVSSFLQPLLCGFVTVSSRFRRVLCASPSPQLHRKIARISFALEFPLQAFKARGGFLLQVRYIMNSKSYGRPQPLSLASQRLRHRR